jgi:hypothetical protein
MLKTNAPAKRSKKPLETKDPVEMDGAELAWLFALCCELPYLPIVETASPEMKFYPIFQWH